jgi:hypothetical protein
MHYSKKLSLPFPHPSHRVLQFHVPHQLRRVPQRIQQAARCHLLGCLTTVRRQHTPHGLTDQAGRHAAAIVGCKISPQRLERLRHQRPRQLCPRHPEISDQGHQQPVHGFRRRRRLTIRARNSVIVNLNVWRKRAIRIIMHQPAFQPRGFCLRCKSFVM